MTYGPERLISELRELGYAPALVTGGDTQFALLAEYTISAGRFAGRVVELGIPAPANYPMAVGASIHVRSVPHLVEFGNVPNVRNVIASALGDGWQYWSINFGWPGERERSTARLLSQINAVFERA